MATPLDSSGNETATLQTLYTLRKEAVSSAEKAAAAAKQVDDAINGMLELLPEAARSGKYADLEDKPTIPATPADIGAATEEQGAKADTALQPGQVSVAGRSGSYTDLIDKPVISESGVQSINAKAPDENGAVVLVPTDVGAAAQTDFDAVTPQLNPTDAPRRATRDIFYDYVVVREGNNEIVYGITRDRRIVGPVGVSEEWGIGEHLSRTTRDAKFVRLAKDQNGQILWGARRDGAFQIGNHLDIGGKASTRIVRDAKYSRLILNQNNEIVFGVRHDGVVEFGGGGEESGASAVEAKTWTADWPRLCLVYMSGQSLSAAAKSRYPDEVFNALAEPSAPGRAFQFGNDSPRITVSGLAGQLEEIAVRTRFAEVFDHHEAYTSGTGATTAWTCLKYLVDADTLPNSAFAVINTSIGGQDIETVNSGAPLINRRRAFQAASDAANARRAIFGDHTLFLLDHQNADRNDESSVYQAKVLNVIDGVEQDVLRQGGDPDGVYTVLTAGQGCCNSVMPSSDVPLTALNLAKANERIAAWGAEYCIESAVGALADGADDPIHRAAIGQARVGLYQARALASMLDGVKRHPLHCDGNAVLAPDGLSATMAYANPGAGGLFIDTTTVTDPAVAGYDDADIRRPRGYMLASSDGKAPHPSGILATNVTVVGNDVTVTFSADATSAVDGSDGHGGAMINVANYYEGQPAGGIDPGDIASGPDRGPRACVRNDQTSAAMTITDPVSETETDIIPHDWAMPQRIPLVI